MAGITGLGANGVPTWLLGWARNRLIILALAAGLAAQFGVPHLLVTYRFAPGSQPIIYRSCTYYGPFGEVVSYPGELVPEDCPHLALLEWQWANARLREFKTRLETAWNTIGG